MARPLLVILGVGISLELIEEQSPPQVMLGLVPQLISDLAQ